MWPGFDPELRQQLAVIREMVALQRQAPTREWPLVYIEDHDALLVIREWPNGSITSYMVSKVSNLMTIAWQELIAPRVRRTVESAPGSELPFGFAW